MTRKLQESPQTGRLTAGPALVSGAGRPPRVTRLFENMIEMTEWRQGPPPAGRPGGRRGGGPQAMRSARPISSGEPFDTSMERIGSPPTDIVRRRFGGGPARADRTASNRESYPMSRRLQGPPSADCRGGRDGGPVAFGRVRRVTEGCTNERAAAEAAAGAWRRDRSGGGIREGRRRPNTSRLVRRRPIRLGLFSDREP
jgi:hypothetical protein